MEIRSLILFVHICGMLMLFAALALELVRAKALSRLYGVGLGLIVLSGIALAMREGLGPFAFVRVSLVAALVMGATGANAVGARLRALSRRPRIALGLGIVYLMVAKPGAAGSLIVIAAALLAGFAANLFPARQGTATTAPL